MMRRQQPGGADHVACTGAQTVVGLDLPSLGSLVVDDGCNARIAFDVALEIQFVRDKMQIPLDFRLAGEMLAPLPFVEELLREGILVGIALRVETGARVAIPVPGAADVGPGLEHPGLQAELAKLVESVQARHAGADDDGIILLGHDDNSPFAPRSPLESN
jgi:hypothetical protein